MTLSLVLGMLFLMMPCAQASSQPEALLRRGALREALEEVTAEVRSHPEDVAAQELYIDMLLTIGLAPRAEREFRDAVRLDPRDPDAHYLLGRATVDPRRARESYEAALKLQPGHARSHMGVAAVYLATGQLEEAEAAYQAAVGFDRTLAEAWLGLVRAQVLTQRPDEARKSARVGLGHVSDEPGLYLTLALLEPATALATLTAGVEAVPDDGRLHEALAEAHLAAGDADAALASAKQALTLDPTLSRAQLVRLYARELAAGWLDDKAYLSVVEANGQQGDEKVRTWDRLAKKHPQSALVLVGRGAALQRQGQAPAGLADLLKAAELDPDNEEAAAAAGLALLADGRPADALPHLSRARAARSWDASLGIAEASARKATGDLDGAIALLQEVVEAHVFHVEAQVHLAQALIDAKRAEEAYTLIVGAMDRLPDPRLGAAFVLVATEAGHFEEAATLLDQVVSTTGNAQLAQAAAQLRELARKGGGAPR